MSILSRFVEKYGDPVTARTYGLMGMLIALVFVVLFGGVSHAGEMTQKQAMNKMGEFIRDVGRPCQWVISVDAVQNRFMVTCGINGAPEIDYLLTVLPDAHYTVSAIGDLCRKAGFEELAGCRK